MAKKQPTKKATKKPGKPREPKGRGSPPRDKKPPGRPTMFSPEMAERVCAKIAEGDTVEEVGGRDGFPAASTIFRWLATQDSDTLPPDAVRPHEAFRESYVRACELRAVPRFERIRFLADLALKKPDVAQAVKVAADLEKWCLEREAPKKYGKALTVKGDKESPLEVRKTVEMSDEALLAIAGGGLAEAL